MDTVERISELVAPLVAEAGVELYDIEFAAGTLRISIDRPGGVDMGVVGTLSRSISRLIDDTDPIGGRFTLEVSSPGLERPLRTPEHFTRAIGELVTVKLRAGVEGDRRVAGTVSEVHPEGFTVTTSDTAPGADRRVAFDDVERARTVFEWGPAPKPGRAKASPSAKKKAAKS
ncbi:ribosome maturation factor RimP [soil metagenome]